MSYTPTEWTSGDVITAEKLNKIENGVETASDGSSAMLVELTYVDAGRYDKYYKSDILAADVVSAYTNGTPVVFHFPPEADPNSDGNREVWAHLEGYSTVFLNGTHFLINETIHNSYGLNDLCIGEDGYIHFEIYVD